MPPEKNENGTEDTGQQDTGQQDTGSQDTGSQDTGKPDTGADSADEVAKWKALARKHEERAKANAEKASRFDEIEKANMSELERERKAREDAETEARKLLRTAIAAQKGVPEDLLSGSTREELEAAADRLVEFRGTPQKDRKPDFGGGDRGGDVGSKGDQITSRDELSRMTPAEIVKAEAEGRLDTLLGKNK